MWNLFGEHMPFDPLGTTLSVWTIALAILFIIIALWSLTWKAVALWHAARNGQRLWLIAFLLINTVGVLEIVYLAWFQKKNNDGDADALFPFLKKQKTASPSVPEESSTHLSEVKKDSTR